MGVGQIFILIIFAITLFLVPILLAIRTFLAPFFPKLQEQIRIRGWGYTLWLFGIILILFVLFPYSPGGIQANKNAKTAALMENIQTAILAYQTEYDKPPPGKDNATLIRELMSDNPRSIAFLNIRPTTDMNAKGEALDAWGTPLHISLADPQHPIIQSAGVDKKWNTQDDMGSAKNQP